MSGNEIPHEARQLIYTRSDMRCERCGVSVTWNGGHVHHRQGRALRDHRAVNLFHLCTDCHRWVHANPVAARSYGYIVSRHEDPADVPVMHYLYARVFLAANGDFLLAASKEGEAP